MATMIDVAKKAGVSVSTVSYALSGARPISEETRRRILQAVEELGYHPNLLARGLASKRTRIIALLYPAVSKGYLDDVQLDFIASITNITTYYGYGLLLFTSPSGEYEITRFAKEGLVDGIILMEVQIHDSRVTLMNDLGYPFSLIGHCAHNDGISYVDMDFYAGLRQCVEHLAALKHRQIAFLPTIIDPANSPQTYIVESLRGFNETTQRLGIHSTIYGCDPTVESGFTTMQTVLAQQPGLTAVIAGTESIYTGLVQALAERRLNIPKDISVIGMVSQRSAEKYTPKVTSLTIPSTEMGRMGAEFLIKKLEGQEIEPQQMLLAPLLMVRQSTARYKKRV